MIPDVKIERTRGTVYALCLACGYDVLWPSWCKCRPRRVYTVADLEEDED